MVKTLLALLFRRVVCAVQHPAENGTAARESPVASLKINEPMPDFSLPDAARKTIKLNEVAREKKLVMINFWATWCGPCRVEIPSFENFILRTKATILSSWRFAEERSKLANICAGKRSVFVLIDQDGALLKRFGIESLPTTILVGGDGKVRQVHEGVAPQLEYSVKAALKSEK